MALVLWWRLAFSNGACGQSAEPISPIYDETLFGCSLGETLIAEG